MRRWIIFLVAALAIGAAIIIDRYFHETEAIHAVRSSQNNSRSDAAGISTPAVVPVNAVKNSVANDNSSVSQPEKLREKLKRLQKCGDAQSILQAQDIKIRGGCARDKDPQTCIEQGYSANEKNPYLAQFKKDLSLCSESKNLQSDIYLAYRAAAEAGDVDAQLCFAAGFGRQEGNSGISGIDDYDADYRSLAAKYVEAAFARGDWRIVEKFSQQHTFMGDVSLAAVYPYGTPEVAYKMNRLLQMGATGQYADEVADTIKDLTSPDAQGRDRLTSQQIQDGDKWAEKMYSSFFERSARLTKAPGDLCEQN